MLRENLGQWIAANGTQHLIEDLHLPSEVEQLRFVDNRSLDLYYSLVGELFRRLREPTGDGRDWAAIGRAFDDVSRNLGDGMHEDALFFSASAFYIGGYPASAVITIRKLSSPHWDDPVQEACYELLSRNLIGATARSSALLNSVREGNPWVIESAIWEAEEDASRALNIGPDEWVCRRVYLALLNRFRRTNLRAVLPDGFSARWDSLVGSFLDRRQPVWDFFPSQIDAIDAGLLDSDDTFSLQMPTGAGKTALTETLLYGHLSSAATAKAVLLVPYRALAKELRGTVGSHLRSMGLPTRAVYGGTVPTPEEGRDLDATRAIIATPEALNGLIGAYPDFLGSISLVVCDEGHLIDGRGRGIGLELLLARLKSRPSPPRLVFVSAIVPNIEEINSWLGGSDTTVIRSVYQPALAEFATLKTEGNGSTWSASLELHEPQSSIPSHTLDRFLENDDFKYLNPSSGRMKTLPHQSKSSVSVAAARRALALGTVALFAAQKGGTSGIVGLAEQLVRQDEVGLSLPSPIDFVRDRDRVRNSLDYMAREFGEDWIGSQVLKVGAVMHHGDLPQETRDVLEDLVADRVVSMVLCTSTLAEGVNLPIRTMVLYSVERRANATASSVMLQREIKNLVGRAGRATSSTRGLVISANDDVWRHVQPIAEGAAGERVDGALLTLIRELSRVLEANNNPQVTNNGLEATPQLLPLVDGIDSMLIELIHEEIGADEFREIAKSVSLGTFAAQRASEKEMQLLNSVVSLRSEKLLELRDNGRLAWVKTAPVKPRLVSAIADDLLVGYDGWESLDAPSNPQFITHLVEWSFRQPGFERDVQAAVRNERIDQPTLIQSMVARWISGQTFVEMSASLPLNMNELLRVHNSVVLNSFATLIEQAIALIRQRTDLSDFEVAPMVLQFPEFLKFGVQSEEARYLMANGLRHRRAAIELGLDVRKIEGTRLMETPWSIAREILRDRGEWQAKLGELVFDRTAEDLAARRMS